MVQILLISLILMISIFSSEGINNTYIGTMSNRSQLIEDKVYNLDLDGDGTKEKIIEKPLMENDEKICTKLYINNKVVMEYIDDENTAIYLRDFNKVDNTREICVVKGDTLEDITTEILFYNEDNIDTYSIKGKVNSYDNKSGLIKIENVNLSETSFKSFQNIIGSDDVYIKNSYKRIYDGEIENKDKSKIDLNGKSANKEYTVINDIRAYESIEENGEYIDIKSEDKLNIISLNKVGKDKYIKIKYNNKYWWIKCMDTQLFK